MASSNPADEDYDPSLVNTGVYNAPPPAVDTSKYPPPPGYTRDATGKLIPIPGYFAPGVDASDPTKLPSTAPGFDPTTMTFKDQRTAPPPAASGDLMSRIKAALAAAGSTDDPNYWMGVISKDPNGAGSAWDYWVGRINQGDGAAAVRNGTAQKFNDGGGGLPGGTLGSLLDKYPGGPPPAYVDPRNSMPTMPGYTPPPAFEAPTGDQVRSTPGYQFGLDEGLKGVQASAAAKGTLNTGGTLEDVLKYGVNYADQNYQTALNNAANIYGTNYATQYLDPYNFKLKGYQNDVNANDSAATGQNLYNQNNRNFDYNAWRNHNNDVYDYLYKQQTLGTNVQ